jgi:hypothetical protein
MTLTFDRLVSPTVVGEIGPQSVRTLLTHHAPALTVPAGGKRDEAAELAAWMRDLLPEEHPTLFEHLHAIVHLLSQEDLQHTLTSRGLSLPPGQPLGEALVQLAISTPEVLEELSARASLSEAQTAKTFVTFRRTSSKTFRTPPLTPEVLRRLEHACQGALEGAGHGRYCRIWPSVEGKESALVIAYAAALRSKRVISRADSAELQTNRFPRDAVVLLSEDGKQMRVSAGTSRERELFATAVGSALLGADGHFESAETYDLDVICTKAFEQKLKRLQGEDFSAVSLTDLLLIKRDHLGTRVTLHSPDVFETSKDQRVHLDQFEPRRAVLQFLPADARRRRRWRIELRGSDTRKCTAPWSDRSVDALLGELGLLRRAS